MGAMTTRQLHYSASQPVGLRGFSPRTVTKVRTRTHNSAARATTSGGALGRELKRSGYRKYAAAVFLGDDLLAYLVLALGGALALGNLLAMVRPNPHAEDGDLVRAPLGRSLVMAMVGALAAVWAAVSLFH